MLRVVSEEIPLSDLNGRLGHMVEDLRRRMAPSDPDLYARHIRALEVWLARRGGASLTGESVASYLRERAERGDGSISDALAIAGAVKWKCWRDRQFYD